MKTRIERLQKQIHADAALIEYPPDLLYLTGLLLSRGILAVTPKEAVLFVDGRYFANAEKKSPCPVRLLESNAVIDWFKAQGIKSVAFDGAYTTYDRYIALKKDITDLKGTSGLLKQARVIKDSREIEGLKSAADLTWRGYKHISSLLKEGISEEELAFEFEVFVRKHGASGLSFDSIVAFGENSAYPHHRAGKATLKKDQIVLMDVGAVRDNYHGDLTRVEFFGAAHPELVKMLQWTKDAQKAAFEIARISTSFGALDVAARKVFRAHGVEESFTHGLGHGIGLETHEFPSIKAAGPDKDVLLEEGMVFTIEPGLYRPGLGGVRWEDMVLVTQEGPVTLYPEPIA